MPPKKTTTASRKKINTFNQPSKNKRAYTVVSPGHKGLKKKAKVKEPEKNNPFTNPKLIAFLLLTAVLVGVFIIYYFVHNDTTPRISVINNEQLFIDSVYGENKIGDINDWIDIKIGTSYERIYKITATESKMSEFFGISKLYVNGQSRIFLGSDHDFSYYLVKLNVTWYVNPTGSDLTVVELTDTLPKIIP